MAVSKYWGDERHPDAIYAVYLKKVRYVPPTGYEGLPHYRTIDPDKHHLAAAEFASDHLQWETIRDRVIKAGSLQRLVECLISSEDKMDSRHFNVFFSTYRGFATPEEVANILMEWFERLDREEYGSKADISVQDAIRSIFVCWLDMYPEDFYESDAKFALLYRLVDFTKTHNLIDLKQKARTLRQKFKRVADEGGISAQLPSIDRYTFALGYDSKDYLYSQERAKMFDVGKDNCVQIAEQLTFWDAALFKELLPYQCQGAIWGRRHKNHPDTVYSVRATIDQFNAVSQRVMTSIVLPECRNDFRSKIIEKWIDIARELRALKNFSSLKAVLSSLQSEPVYRLKSAWALVPKVYMAQFKELTSIFETDSTGDSTKARNILDAEGTAKQSPLKRPQLIQNCRRTKSDVNLAECQGTVPYLGSFLTDLAMVDQALPDYNEDGLINFEKRRREFEVLAKIRLFQSAARAYNVPMDKGFCAWFYYLPSLSENECFTRSLEIERATNSTPDMRRAKQTNGIMSITPSVPIPKINTLSLLLNKVIFNDDSSQLKSSPIFAKNSNDSGIHTEDSWASNSSTPSDHHMTVANLVARGRIIASTPVGLIAANRSFTAPSTPASTISWRGGSEFNPYTHFTPNMDAPCHSGAQVESISLSSRVTSDYRNLESVDGSRCETPLKNVGAKTDGYGYKNGRTTEHNGHRATASQMSNTSSSSSNSSICNSPAQGGTASATKNNFHLARVGLDDALQTTTSGANYKCIKVENGDRMQTLIERALEKHLLDTTEKGEYILIQLLPDGSEFRLPDHCNPFYAVAPDPTSPMLNFILRKREDEERPQLAPSAKKLNRMKRSNLLRWSSGYL